MVSKDQLSTTSLSLLEAKRDEKIVIVGTNFLSRGLLNYPHCELVINLDVPIVSNYIFDCIVYAHRAGKTGRMNRDGTVLTILDTNGPLMVNDFKYAMLQQLKKQVTEFKLM